MARLRHQTGFTLMELVIVIVVMGIIATVALRSMDAPIANARFESTMAEMDQLATAITGNPALYSNGVRTDFGYVGDNGALPPNLDALVTNTGLGTWNGPYVKSSFSEAATDFKRDAWGVNYDYNGVTIQSTGGSPDTLTRQFANSTADLLSNSVEVFISDAAGNPPGDSAGNVSVALSYPDGAGGTQDSILAANTSGRAVFSATVPIGNHEVQAVYSTSDDTVSAVVSVLPGGTSYVTLRFPGALWAADVGGGGGGGTGGGDLAYVSGSASVSGGDNDDIEFSVENSGASAVTISWLVLTYSHSPTAYFEELKCDGMQHDSWNPRAGSGDTIAFASPVTLSESESESIEIETFVDKRTGAGNVDPVDMRNADITVTFSDGSVITFNTGS